MKNYIFFTILVCLALTTKGQVNEFGVFVGGSNYVGDIGRTDYLYPDNLAGAIVLKRNLNPRFALRATYSYLPISGDDRNAETDLKRNRGYKFTNLIHEGALGIEWNFYDYDISTKGKHFTPYILLEAAVFNYKSPVLARPTGVVEYKKKTAFALPIGVGYKSKLAGNLAFAIEAKVRYTFEDDLDYSSKDIELLNFGKTGNDWYMFTGISLVYTFGRPSCYSKGL